MKATGVVRKIDDLGRITLPKEMRDILSIEDKTPIEIFSCNDGIFLKKYEGGCIFCGEANNVRIFEEKRICANCFSKLKEH